MTFTARTIFLLLAVICFALAAFGVTARIDWTNAGYACVTLAFLIG
jgi:hypothetical protein